jgi:hypothetical protein
MSILNEGHPTTITFSQAGASGLSVLMLEKEVTPPSLDGGGPNDTTTMRNDAYRTKQPKVLITLGQASFLVAYDPACYDDLVDILNVNGLITITFSDGSTLGFYGWLDKFTPNRITEGAQPTAECIIECSNQNGSGVETAPDYTA